MTPPKNGLTAEQEKTLLALINDAGADAWNEGENQLDFQAACANYQLGRIDFKIGITVPAAGGKPARTLVLFRGIDGISQYSDLVETAQNGSQLLTSATFDKLVALAAEVNKSLADQQAAEQHHGARPDAR